MDEDEEEHQFLSQSKKREEKLRGIIAVMGLPVTLKTELAAVIGKWAKCPVLCVQHFLDGDDKKVVVDANADVDVDVDVDTDDVEGERRRQQLIQRAFPRLCNVAKFHLSWGYEFFDRSTVVIKSRLKSTFELDRLIELVTGTKTGNLERYPVLIIDCRMRNEIRWKNYFEAPIEDFDYMEDEGLRRWYRPASWKEMEDLIARDHENQASWDLYLQQLRLKASHDTPTIIRRLVVDPIYDDTFSYVDICLTDNFADAIKYLLTTPQEELIDNFQNPYTMEYRELRPYLLERRWSAAESKGRRKYICPGGDCVFKYSNTLILHYHDDDDDDKATSASSNLTYCGVCDEQVVSETPAYTCRKCTLTLHKSCAERVDFKALKFKIEGMSEHYRRGEDHLPQTYACGSCENVGKPFGYNCGSCLFQTHLKCDPLPTIINHDSHPHFLFLYLTRDGYVYRACGEYEEDFSYRCVKCASFYDLGCAFLPLELLKHKHGGHEHVMKLMFSLHEDGMEHEETYWCEVFYKGMDPEDCCYLCQNCPYYITHVKCAGFYQFLHYPKDVKLVQQLQPQLEDAFP